MIYTDTKCRKQKKKPGWEAAQKQEQEWLKSINSMSAFSTNKYKGRVSTEQTKSHVVNGRLVGADRKVEAKSLGSIVTGGTKSVARPEIQYKDNPELLQRELEARQRKFNVAPAFNKGGDQFVTEEELAKQLRGNKRR